MGAGVLTLSCVNVWRKKKKISQCLSTANIGGSFHRSGLSRHGCEHTCTNLRKRRLKRPMSCELGRYTSLSSWSTDLCCSPMPSSIAWKTVSHWDTALDAILGRYRKSIPKKKKRNQLNFSATSLRKVLKNKQINKTNKTQMGEISEKRTWLTHCATDSETSPSWLRKNKRATVGIRSMMRW